MGRARPPGAPLHFVGNRVRCVSTHCHRPSRFTKTSVARSCVLNSCPMNLPFVRVTPITTALSPDPEIFGFHHVVRQGARFDDLQKAHPVNYSSVRVNDDPVIC